MDHPLLLLHCLLFSIAIPASSAVNPQGQALLSWKRSLDGSPDVLSNWDPMDDTPCGWFGVSCNFNEEVAELNLRYVDLFGNAPSSLSFLLSLNRLVLSGTNLTGPIPKEIGTLQQLSFLDLSDNALTGGIPSELCHLPILQELYLNSNRLEGSIPAEIGNLTNLASLIVFDNQLNGEIPSSIGNLVSLQVVRAGGNKNLAGPIPLEIGNCSNLVLLGLAETNISGMIPRTIGKLKKLETLAIYTAQLSGQIPLELTDCNALQNIYLYENSLTGSIPNQLGNLRNLQNLLLWQNNLVGTIPPGLGNCKQLLVVDLSLNSLTGGIPATFGNLTSLQELQLSVNQLSGPIPSSVGRCTSLTHIELDNNQITGAIPSEFGNLTSLALMFLWQNRLEGNIPSSIASSRNLEAIDLSQNTLTGPIPNGIFELQKLNKLLLLSNNLSGAIPQEIGKCASLIRFRTGENALVGSIPPEIGNLKRLNFLDLGSNKLTGIIPSEISECRNLTFLDLHSNSITGSLPENLNLLSSLQFIDVSDNFIGGKLSSSIDSMTSLTKLVLRNNKFTGSIPSQLGFCSRLQLIDLSSNQLSGEIPPTLGKIAALEISLNLSCNNISGEIPSEFQGLDKLGVLDIAHNQLSGDLTALARLENLVVLNVSHNNFSGLVPDTTFFSKLPLSVLAGNQYLCFTGNRCSAEGTGAKRRTRAATVAMVVLLCTACALLLAAIYIMLWGRIRKWWPHGYDGNSDDVELNPPWEVTLYQKLSVSIVDVAKCLTAGNVIGRGRSGVVYKAHTSSGLTIAVKRFRPSDKYSASAFSSEISTLARIRHRNIIRLLGWGANRTSKLLLYDFLPNGTLGALLHEKCGELVDMETRLKIALGVAEGLAYLHHDCVPPIVHRDVKAHNILLGDRYEPCLADFGLARFLDDDNSSILANPEFAGSFGYIAPEYACLLKITEKSDVYSYGVVLLELITGKWPVDPSFIEGQHVIQWVREHLKGKKDPVETLIDPSLQGLSETQIQEMIQALGIALLCTSNRPDDRPAMKDVVALLKGIRHESSTVVEGHKPTDKQSDLTECHSYSSSSMSVTPTQLLLLQGSSNCLFNHSSSSANYPSRHQ